MNMYSHYYKKISDDDWVRVAFTDVQAESLRTELPLSEQHATMLINRWNQNCPGARFALEI